MLDIITNMIIVVSIIGLVLIVIMMANIYNPDHPLNQNRTDQD